uniref:Uncharacterized protein n=1 Tax=Vespula pensylvanica TaxID=30213 RepID=A0A834K8Q3_VESPE|nr:hypothetical protein H0235_015271 [Vespula pensylvanica]
MVNRRKSKASQSNFSEGVEREAEKFRRAVLNSAYLTGFDSNVPAYYVEPSWHSHPFYVGGHEQERCRLASDSGNSPEGVPQTMLAKSSTQLHNIGCSEGESRGGREKSGDGSVEGEEEKGQICSSVSLHGFR